MQMLAERELVYWNILFNKFLLNAFIKFQLVLERYIIIPKIYSLI